MTSLEILGTLGLYMVEASYLPQIARLAKLKEADEFSFLFPSLNIIGRLFGLFLAISKHQPTFTWFFIVGIILRTVLMLQVVYYRTRKRRLSTIIAQGKPLSGSATVTNFNQT